MAKRKQATPSLKLITYNKDLTDLGRLRVAGPEQVAWEESVKAFVAWLIKNLSAKIPFLGWPIVGSIISLLVTPILIEFIKQILLWFNFNIIDRIVDREREKYDQMTDELRKIHDDPNATKEQADEAIENFSDSFSDLIHLDVG